MKKKGETIIFSGKPGIKTSYTLAGEKEKKGPFGHLFDEIYPQGKAGNKSWEKEEGEMG